jgi:hypothetical protein
LRPPARQQDPKQPIDATEVWAPSSAALQHGNLVAQAIASSDSAVRVRGSVRATRPALLVGVAMKADYRHKSETTNESVRIKF